MEIKGELQRPRLINPFIIITLPSSLFPLDVGVSSEEAVEEVFYSMTEKTRLHVPDDGHLAFINFDYFPEAIARQVSGP